MAKPPNTPPNSDIDGVNEDALRNTDAAVDAGQDSGDLERARRESIGRPEQSDPDEDNIEDRSR